MFHGPHILAEDDGFIRLVFIVGVLLFSLLARLFKKKQPAQQPLARRPAPPPPPAPAESVAEALMAMQTRAVARPVAVPAPVAVAAGVRTIRDQVDLDSVDDEVEARERERAARDAARMARLATAAPAEADSAAIEQRISHFQRIDAAAADQGPRITVDLSGPGAARQAVLFQEILGPPKALRRGTELWET